MSPLVPEKKNIENQYQRIAAILIFVLGCIAIVWYLLQVIYCVIMGLEYNFASIESLGRLVIGFVFLMTGWAMFKQIDWEYNTPKLSN